jgi:uncharacterized protein (TIGR02099 family)
MRFAFRLAKHSALWAYRLIAIALFTCALVFAGIVLALRYWILPNIDEYRPRVIQALADASRQRVELGRIEGEWDGMRPRLILRDLRLFDQQGRERVHLDEVDSTLAWLSLFSGELQFYSIELRHLRLEARRNASGTLDVAGVVIGESNDGGGSGLGDWLLRQHRIVLEDSQLIWTDETLSNVPLEMNDVHILIEQFLGTHRFALRATPPAELATPIDIRGELQGDSLGDLTRWSGRLYASVKQADYKLLRQWVKLPEQLIQGAGGAQLWMDITGGRPTGVTADVALSKVRVQLQPELPELALTTLQGRLGWRESSNTLELWARNIMFATPDGVRLPPADIVYSRISGKPGVPERSEATFDALDLEAVERLIDRLPLDPALRKRLSELKPRGTLRAFHVVWQDHFDLSKPYAVTGGFSNVGWHASGYLPGVSNVTADFYANERGGSLAGIVASTQLDMPAAFVAPLPIQRADIKLSWTMAAGLPRINLEQVTLSNAHLSGAVSGTYDAAADGPGTINLKGTFTRASGQEIWRYVPLILPADVRDWLHEGILQASGRDVQLTLKGDLRKFPFSVPGTGLFQVQAMIDDGVVQFGSHWPRMHAVRGRLSVIGHRLEIAVSDAAVFGATLHNLNIVMPDFSDEKPWIQARGEAEGPSSEFLRYLRESPVHERIGRAVDELRATGRGRLALSVEIPLPHASDVRLSGVYTFADNTVVPTEGLPTVEQLSGQLSFTQDEVQLREAQGRIFGRPARVSLGTEPGRGLRIQGSGQVDAVALRRQFNEPLLSRVEGITDWKLSMALQDERSELVIESSLVGLSSSLPAPLYKPAAQREPLRVQRRDADAGQDLYGFTLGSSVSGQLLVNRTGKSRVVRGEIGLGEPASAPQRDGVWITGKLERLDFDDWQDVLSGQGGDGQDEGVRWSGMEVSAQRVRMFSREFSDMDIDATRGGKVWRANLDSPQVAGEVEWSSEGKGALMGRFTRLQLPAPTPMVKAQGGGAQQGKDLPSVDIAAADFRMGTRELGSLTMRASPRGSDWNIERLDLASPEGNLSVKGIWQAWAVNPRTQLEVNLDVNDIGRFFARMQLPKGIEGGKGKLEGTLAWSGPPFALDTPTLEGRLGLSAAKGRFVKVDPGIGKLLAVVSLQNLPKVVTLDFRDIFSQGFAFDQISAHADIVHGLARTQDFNMKGPAARVEMRGEVNLAAETQQLDVKIFPAMSESVALGTALVNPIIGLGALVVQKALKDPLSHLLALEYHIAGTWTAPSVSKKKRDGESNAQSGRK